MAAEPLEQLDNFINGAWERQPERMPAHNPATGEQIAWLPKSDRGCAGLAVAAAKQAQQAWAARSVWERANQCVAIAAKIDEHRARIARVLSLEQGKPLAEAMGEVAKAADGFRLASELAKQLGGQTLPAEDATKLVMTLRQPRGVYAVITPWNYPVNIPVEYLAPGIATGNAIVWVPAPSTSMVAVELMRAIAEAGLPAGIVNLVIGEGATVGDEIVAHKDTNGIGFTGSTATGQRIAARGAGKPMLLELGGNGPVLVFQDADLDKAASAAAAGAFTNAGQICAATGRVLAHHSIAAVLADKIADHAKRYVLGRPPASGHHDGAAEQSWRRQQGAGARRRGRRGRRHGGDRRQGTPRPRQFPVLRADRADGGHPRDAHQPRGNLRSRRADPVVRG